MPSPGTFPSARVPIKVSLCESADAQVFQFISAFRIGRAASCDVCIRSSYASRIHAEVTPESDGWRIRDLNSSNGLYLKGARIENALITSHEVVRLGVDGPALSFRIELQETRSNRVLHEGNVRASLEEEALVAQYAERYFRDAQDGEPVGEHTKLVRKAFADFQRDQKHAHTRQRSAFITTIAVLLLAAVAISTYAVRLHREAVRQRALAHDLFYAMKSLDVEIAEAERLALASDKHADQSVSKYGASRRQMQENYNQFLATLHVYDAKTSEQHRLILRIARVFGECELDMPADFEQEVFRYIKYWQSSGRFARDVSLAKEKGYNRTISRALLERGLPVQFFYLAMQESDFDPYISGPLTRKGFAKGMWQFIPETGVKYGLRLGPLVDLGRPDTSDERDQVDKATDAAARYLQTLYSTDAQASGLLVMACYNWGEDQVLPLVRSMPPNPRDRNFWRLLSEHRNQIPQQTYDYVFYITSAAVIGENPRLFGFDFDNPLDEAAKKGP
jgi:membrane-bound lytic murein transglycosylase D